MIEMPQSPGTNQPRVDRPTVDFTVRQDWLDNIGVPVGQGDFVDANDPADPDNAGHSEYLADLDPRNDHGRANPLNPNSSNYTNYNPTQGRKDLL